MAHKVMTAKKHPANKIDGGSPKRDKYRPESAP
jgi:hypothetical protein